jgi:hypothetical protein
LLSSLVGHSTLPADAFITEYSAVSMLHSDVTPDLALTVPVQVKTFLHSLDVIPRSSFQLPTTPRVAKVQFSLVLKHFWLNLNPNWQSSGQTEPEPNLNW